MHLVLDVERLHLRFTSRWYQQAISEFYRTAEEVATTTTHTAEVSRMFTVRQARVYNYFWLNWFPRSVQMHVNFNLVSRIKSKCFVERRVLAENHYQNMQSTFLFFLSFFFKCIILVYSWSIFTRGCATCENMFIRSLVRIPWHDMAGSIAVIWKLRSVCCLTPDLDCQLTPVLLAERNRNYINWNTEFGWKLNTAAGFQLTLVLSVTRWEQSIIQQCNKYLLNHSCVCTLILLSLVWGPDTEESAESVKEDGQDQVEREKFEIQCGQVGRHAGSHHESSQYTAQHRGGIHYV